MVIFTLKELYSKNELPIVIVNSIGDATIELDAEPDYQPYRDTPFAQHFIPTTRSTSIVFLAGRTKEKSCIVKVEIVTPDQDPSLKVDNFNREIKAEQLIHAFLKVIDRLEIEYIDSNRDSGNEFILQVYANTKLVDKNTEDMITNVSEKQLFRNGGALKLAVSEKKPLIYFETVPGNQSSQVITLSSKAYPYRMIISIGVHSRISKEGEGA